MPFQVCLPSICKHIKNCSTTRESISSAVCKQIEIGERQENEENQRLNKFSSMEENAIDFLSLRLRICFFKTKLKS